MLRTIASLLWDKYKCQNGVRYVTKKRHRTYSPAPLNWRKRNIKYKIMLSLLLKKDKTFMKTLMKTLSLRLLTMKRGKFMLYMILPRNLKFCNKKDRIKAIFFACPKEA